AHPYSPLATLRPYFWLPFAGADALGTTLGAITAGFDIVGRHEYEAAAWWSLSGKQPGFSARYVNHTLYPDLVFTASRDVVDVANLGCFLLADGSVSCPTQRDVHAGVAAVFDFPTLERSWSLSLGYDLDLLADNTVPAGVPVPREGRVSAAFASVVYSEAKRFVRSISPEQGFRAALGVRLVETALGSDFRYRLATASITDYLRMFWSAGGRTLHHALALRLVGGI